MNAEVCCWFTEMISSIGDEALQALTLGIEDPTLEDLRSTCTQQQSSNNQKSGTYLNPLGR